MFICGMALDNVIRKWGATWENVPSDMWVQRKLKSTSSRKHTYIILPVGGSNPRPPDHQSDAYPTGPLRQPFASRKQALFFLFLLKNIDCGYALEPPRGGGSNAYPQSMFWAEIWRISEFFIWKFSFFDGKIFSNFNRHVFVMCASTSLLPAGRNFASVAIQIAPSEDFDQT